MFHVYVSRQCILDHILWISYDLAFISIEPFAKLWLTHIDLTHSSGALQVNVDKSDLDFDLPELEEAAVMVLKDNDEKENSTDSNVQDSEESSSEEEDEEPEIQEDGNIEDNSCKVNCEELEKLKLK